MYSAKICLKKTCMGMGWSFTLDTLKILVRGILKEWVTFVSSSLVGALGCWAIVEGSLWYDFLQNLVKSAYNFCCSWTELEKEFFELSG